MLRHGWDSWAALCQASSWTLVIPVGAFQLRMLYDSMIQKVVFSRKAKSVMCIFRKGRGNGEKDLYVDSCFVNVNHLYEGSLDGGNDSRKTQSLPWPPKELLHEGTLHRVCVG